MIKRTLLSALPLLFLFLAVSCQQNDQKENEDGVSADLVTNPISADGDKKETNLPVMEFEKNLHDFGTIVKGEKVAYNFKFKNSGATDLIISDASSSCGCTVPTYPRQPIKPGKSGEIEVVFNSAGRNGSQHKTVSILTNAQPNTIRLEIEAEVIEL